MEAKDKLQIVLLGTSGSGKSASGNTILGEKVFKSYVSTQSVTLSYQSETKIIDGMEVTVVDTPGWYCNKMTENEVTSELTAAIASLNGPYAFLMVIPIGSFTHRDREREEIEMISKLRRELGEDFINQTTILFSYSDNLESKTFDQFLEEEKGELHKVLQCCGNRVYTWNNRNKSSVSDLHNMLKDLKETQRMNDNSKKCRQKSHQYQDQDLNTCDETGPSDVDMKRHKRETPEPMDDNSKKCRQKSHQYQDQDQDLNTCDETRPSDVDMKRHKRDTPEPMDDTNEAVRVLVLGMAGVGKTSTIQTLLGQDSKIKRNPPQVHMTSRSGMSFMLFDSFGFESVNEVGSVISQSLSRASPGPHVIMIIIKVGRVNEETYMINGIHARLEDSVKHTMIVFSRKDDLEGKPIDQFIQESPALKNVVEMHGERFHALNNKDINDQTQADELFEKILAMYRDNNEDFIKEPSGQQDNNEDVLKEPSGHHEGENKKPGIIKYLPKCLHKITG